MPGVVPRPDVNPLVLACVNHRAESDFRNISTFAPPKDYSCDRVTI